MTTGHLHPSARPGGKLTPSEARVLAFAAAGYTKGETARFLRVGAETVKSQRTSLQRKLRARNIAHAVAIVASRGLLGPETLARVEALVQRWQ